MRNLPLLAVTVVIVGALYFLYRQILELSVRVEQISHELNFTINAVNLLGANSSGPQSSIEDYADEDQDDEEEPLLPTTKATASDTYEADEDSEEPDTSNVESFDATPTDKADVRAYLGKLETFVQRPEDKKSA